jgi:hypothetical protein
MLHKNFTGFSLSELSVNVVCSPRYLVKKEGVFGWSERKKNEKQTAGLKTSKQRTPREIDNPIIFPKAHIGKANMPSKQEMFFRRPTDRGFLNASLATEILLN